MSEKLYTIAEVARRLQVSRQTVYVWIQQGEIKTVRLDSGRQGVSQSTLDDLSNSILPVEKRTRQKHNLLYELVRVKRS